MVEEMTLVERWEVGEEDFIEKRPFNHMIGSADANMQNRPRSL